MHDLESNEIKVYSVQGNLSGAILLEINRLKPLFSISIALYSAILVLIHRQLSVLNKRIDISIVSQRSLYLL